MDTDSVRSPVTGSEGARTPSVCGLGRAQCLAGGKHWTRLVPR